MERKGTFRKGEGTEPVRKTGLPGRAGKRNRGPWEMRRISEIADHSLGKMLDRAKNKGVPLPYLRNLNVRWFGFDLSDLLTMKFLPEEMERFTVRKGDLVICEGGYPGRAAIWDRDEPVYFQKALHRVRFHEPRHAKWCLYCLLSKDLDGTLREHFNGAGIQHFTRAALAKFEIPLPPLPEQQRIVEILDEAFEGIATATAHAERNLQNARELFQSVLQSTFQQKGEDWVETTLGECGRTQTGSTPKTANPEFYGNHIPFIKPGDFAENGSLNYENGGLSESGLAVSRMIQGNSAIMVCIGATIGKSGLCDRPITTNQQINALVPKPALNAKFAYYQFTTDGFQALVRLNAGQATLPIISKSKWSSLPFVLPPLSEQKSIVQKLDALSAETRRLEAIYQRKLAAFAELKQYLLHRAFSGKL